MNVKIDPSWKKQLAEEFSKEYFEELVGFVKSEYSTKAIYPPPKEIFRAFNECKFENCKVVILGQDPYHTPDTANGLSFSVRADKDRLPPSLINIYKELKSDLSVEEPENGDLSRWAKQGVLLLNSVLTVRKGEAASHSGKGWERFTDAVIKVVSDQKDHVVFILWGKYAQNKGEVIDRYKHLVIESSHPSPFSADRGFFGSKPFSKTNEYLGKHGLKEIEW